MPCSLLPRFLATSAVAQDGPPPEVRRAVSALLEVVNSDGDTALDEFLATADPAWVAAEGKAEVIGQLREIRAAARGLDDDVSVEATPDGVEVVLTGDGVERRVALTIADSGVSGVRLLADQAGKVRQPGRNGAVRAHIAALEQSGRESLESLVAEFESTHFSAAYMAETTSKERSALLEEIRSVAANSQGAMLQEAGDETVLELRGPKNIRIVFKVETQEPFAIDALRLEEADPDAPAINLTWENAGKTFKKLEREGFSGVVHLARDGRTLLHSAYGLSNRELGYKNQLDTIFGIGSTPIDFTVTGIYLLVQENKLSLDDTIGKYFDGVPEDKASMSIAHLINGQSGLPDFHGFPDQDWDLDLAWIDRDTAVTRILAQPLLFAPGKSRAHSHSAYGLAAAIIEIASGKDYYSFVRDAILQPAGMTRTGMYGDDGGFGLRDFAVGYSNKTVGVPNIPPNWGPTSWLVMGSGGMYSTLGDMLRFYEFVRSGKALEERFARRYLGEGIGIGGSERGFYIFHANRGKEKEVMMIINGEGRSPKIRALSRAMENLVTGGN